MKAYIAGPMRGYENYNFDAFDRAKISVNTLGYHAISPANLDRMFEGWGTYPPEDFEVTIEFAKKCISRDIDAIIDMDPTTDIIYMLNGWENSKGALVEKALAEFLGLAVVLESGDEDWL